MLADATVSRNIKAVVKLQTSVANEDIYCLSSMKDSAWILLFCIAIFSLSWESYETKYHSSHIEPRIMNALFKLKLQKSTGKHHKNLKDAESFAKSCYIKNCSEKFYNFRRKESLMKTFLSYVLGSDFIEKELHNSLTALNPIQDGTFRGCSKMGGLKKAALWNLSHISYNMKLCSYTFAKEDPKNMWITWHTSWVMLTSAISMLSLEIKKYRYRFHFGT